VPRRLLQTVAAMIDDAERHRAVGEAPVTVVAWREPDRLASQRRADIDELALPFDLPVRAHPPDLLIARILGLAQHAVEAPRRRRVMFGGCGIGERLVRALLVVEAPEGVEAVELLPQAARRRVGGVLQQGQVQPLQSAVLLRLARRDPLRRHPRLDEQHGQPRQAAAGAGKRRAVVGAQRLRQAELAEGGVEDRPNMLGVAPGQHLTAQQIAAVRIGQRQRLTTRAVAGEEPALEIDRPHVVGSRAGRKRRTRRRRLSRRFTVSPSRSNNPPIVLAAGQRVAGARR
jgi:hypothetical protein